MSTNKNAQTLCTGIAIGATCSMALTWFLQKQHGQQGDKASPDNSTSRGLSSSNRQSAAPRVVNVPPELREEQLSRHTLYFGEKGMTSIKNARICIVGLGGVGSHTAMMLARGGAEFIRFIDFDQVTLSSLNRHACATLHDVGIPKVTCMQNYLAQLGLTPDTHIETRVAMYTEESGPSLLGDQKWDLVIDAIDDVPTKAALLAYCICNKIRVYSCMGAGGKSDMTRLHLSDLRTASRDPLASKLRQTMKRTMKRFRQTYPREEVQETPAVDDYLDDMEQLTIIYSSEKVVAKLADLTDEQKATANKSEFGAVDGMRIRVLPVLGPLPAIMGQSLAALALCELGEKPIHQPFTGERLGRNVRHKLLQHLKRRETWVAEGKVAAVDISAGKVLYIGPVEVDHDDVEYLMGVWRNRCGVSGARLGTVLELVRWDYTKPATCDNLVVMCTHARESYDTKGRAEISPATQTIIEKRLAHCRDRTCELF